MACLQNINRDGAYDGQQRSPQDFQFDLVNVLTMSRLVRKSARERNAAGHSCRYQEQHCTRGCGWDRAVLAASTAGRAKVIVREYTTKNGAWAWAKLREAVRRRVARVGKKVSKRAQGVTEFTSD